MVGKWPSSDASRSHIEVCGSIGPIERYSAIPSMNHSGGFTLMSVWTPAPMRPRAPAPPLLLRSVAWGSSFLPVVPRAPGEHRSIAPQPLELVEFPQLGVEHMHYEIHVVEQHPPPLRQPFHMMRCEATRRQRCHQMLRHPPHVGVGRPGNDYEIVGGGAESPQVQYQRVDRLAIEQRLGDELQRRLRVHDGPLRRTPASPRAPAPAATHSAAHIRLFRLRCRYSFTTLTRISGRTSGWTLIPTWKSPSSRIGSGRSTLRLSTWIPSSSSLRWTSPAVTEPYSLSSSPTL